LPKGLRARHARVGALLIVLALVNTLHG